MTKEQFMAEIKAFINIRSITSEDEAALERCWVVEQEQPGFTLALAKQTKWRKPSLWSI